MAAVKGGNGGIMALESVNPPRVCILLESYFPVVGGMETAAIHLSDCLSRANIPVFFITRRTSPDLAKRETVNGLTVYRVPPSTKSSRARWFVVFTCLPLLFRKRREYDVIFVPGYRALGISAVIMGKLLGKKSILKAENQGEMSGVFFAGGLKDLKLKPSSRMFRLFMAVRNRILASADAFISLSAEMTQEFLTAGVSPDRIHLIPQPVDAERFHPSTADEKERLREKLGLPGSDLIVIFTGRLVTYKGLMVLTAAWEKICASRRDVRLLVVGAGGVDLYNCEAELKEYVRSHHLADRVVFTGAVRNVDEYLKASDIYAFPTENEGFPLAVLEAMACGLPVVSTPVGGIKDILVDGQNGLVVKPRNEQELREAIDRLLSDGVLRQRLGEAGRHTAVKNYTREIISDQYLALFNQLTQRVI